MSNPQHAPDLPPVLIAAFDGWNDAGSAATAAVELLAEAWGAVPIDTLDSEDYHDFQVNRPITMVDPEGNRRLEWPDTTISIARSSSGRRVLFVQGVEPSLRWRSFADEIIASAHTYGVELLIGVGALLADTPHSRPIPVHRSSEDPRIQHELGIERSDYEGPTGILGVLGYLATERGIPSMSVWAAVPHYVAQPPSPKATLALVGALEETLGEPVPTADLEEEARAWQRGVNELAQEDPEISDYVRALEEAKDTSELPEASGEAIAREFERYLRRRDDGD